MKFLSELSKTKFKGTAIVALDFNTEDEWRMKRVLPTLKLLRKNGSKVLILSHFGRPKAVRIVNGSPRGKDLKLSLRRKAIDLSKMIGTEVGFIPHFRFGEIKKILGGARPGSVFVLENIRFLSGEAKNSLVLARSLASFGDFYVNDAFANSHRSHASIEAITQFLPSYAGLEFESEMKGLASVMKKPKKPLVIIIGGGKASDKVGLILNLKNKADIFLLGGAPANTLLRLRGMDIGDSLADRGDDEAFKDVFRLSKVVLPTDFKIRGTRILDLGPKTLRIFENQIKKAGTIVWNGPVGFFEKPPYHRGSLRIARAIAANRRCFSLAGGGETVTFLKKYRLDRKFSFISTGGGAMLEFLAGKELPGIKALEISAKHQKTNPK